MSVWIETFKDFKAWADRSPNLQNVRIRGIDFSQEILKANHYSFANLFGLDLSGAYFEDCKFGLISLTECNFENTEFRRCVFNDTIFRRCNFHGARLLTSKFTDTTMYGVNFSCDIVGGCEFNRVRADETTSFFNIMCPEEGSFIGYKKAILFRRGGGNYYEEKILVKLRITEDAKRSSATSYKCRASKVQVIGFMKLRRDENDFMKLHIVDEDFKLPSGYGVCSSRDQGFLYELGAIIQVPDFDENRWDECAEGIHFFMNKNMARDYQI